MQYSGLHIGTRLVDALTSITFPEIPVSSKHESYTADAALPMHAVPRFSVSHPDPSVKHTVTSGNA